MTDEIETKKEDDVKVSEKELEDIEKSIIDKDKANEDALKKEIEDKVRKEMETEQKLKELEETKAKLEATIAKQAKEKEEIEKNKTQDIEELKKQIGSTKAIVNNNNPFQKPVNQEENSNFGENLNSDDLKDVDEASKMAFLKKQGLSDNQWI